MRELKVDWEDFEDAFVIGNPNSRYFLNVATSTIEYVSFMDDEATLNRMLEAASGDDWVEIPRAGMKDGLEEIRIFIGRESDTETRARLNESLESEKAFQAFNTALGSDRELRQRWSSVRLEGIQKRLLNFCLKHDLFVDSENYRSIQAKFAD